MTKFYLVIIFSSLGGATSEIPMESKGACMSAMEALVEHQTRKNEYLCISTDGKFIYSSKLGELAGE